MSLPTISFKHTHTEPEPVLQDVLTKKFTAFEKYIGDETDVRCEVEFTKLAPQQSGHVFRVEANMWLAGTLYRAEANDESFEKAIDEVRNELDKELRRSVRKRETLFKKGARRMKEMMRFGR